MMPGWNMDIGDQPSVVLDIFLIASKAVDHCAI